ncbi:MAG: alpha/beta hydrolase [Candidatus Sumerlaeia bacterium]
MALIQCDFFSEVLGMCMSMNVILPEKAKGLIGMEGTAQRDKHPTLYLLHGRSDDHSIWLRRTSIERYVAPLGLAVVMPAVHLSYYCNLKDGGQYWDYISQEVPAKAREFFPLSEAREDNFAAGLSMGGFGAFKLGLNCPDQYAAAASLSGALWTPERFAERYNQKARPEMRRSLEPAMGSPEEFKGSINDFIHQAQAIADQDKPRPKLYQCCGTEDFLYKANAEFRDRIEPLGFDYTYEEEPGIHEWAYWDKKIQRVLDWLPLSRG